MWYTWIVLSLVCCALVEAGEVEATGAPEAVATTRAPPRTLDRKADELAWHSWLQDPENENQNATHRRITTKSLFITPLVCPKGQRYDRNGCVQIVTVHKDEHERILVDQLNAFFTSAPNNGNNGEDQYDYGDEEQGPLQLTIPIGQDPQALQIDLAAQAQNQQPAYAQLDKKGGKIPDNEAASIEAELELLKLQAPSKVNRTGQLDGSNIHSHNLLNNLLTYSDKPKRDSPLTNSTEEETIPDKGQEELIFGHVNVDPVVYNVQNQKKEEGILEENKHGGDTLVPHAEQLLANMTNTDTQNKTDAEIPNTTMQSLKAAPEQSKLSPENEYSDIGEAIKLISRYADVSTDDNMKQDSPADESVLGTRTKPQYRRNKPKIADALKDSPVENSDLSSGNKGKLNLNSADIWRYRWPNASPPPDYPFKHLQDYWQGRNQVGGLYNSMHENPRRHHHSYPHNFRPRTYTFTGPSDPSYPMFREPYPRLRRYSHKIGDHIDNPTKSHAINQDLYSLLGLRHWFGSEGASKR